MKLANYLDKNHIMIIESCPDSTAFYHEFTLFLKEQGIIDDHKGVKRLFLKREAVQSTGIGKGAAAPHIYSAEFQKFYIFVSQVRKGIDFKSPDGIPVSLIFIIVSDDRDVGLHLKSLAHISRMVLQSDVVEQAKKCSSADELYSLITEIEKKL